MGYCSESLQRNLRVLQDNYSETHGMSVGIPGKIKQFLKSNVIFLTYLIQKNHFVLLLWIP